MGERIECPGTMYATSESNTRGGRRRDGDLGKPPKGGYRLNRTSRFACGGRRRLRCGPCGPYGVRRRRWSSIGCDQNSVVAGKDSGYRSSSLTGRI